MIPEAPERQMTRKGPESPMIINWELKRKEREDEILPISIALTEESNLAAEKPAPVRVIKRAYLASALGLQPVKIVSVVRDR